MSQQVMSSDAGVTQAPASLLVEGIHKRQRQLMHLLIAKLFADLLFVSWLAVSFHYKVLNPYFRGALDRADAE